MNEYPLIEEKVIGYRVYKLYDEIYGSYYSRHPCPDIGVKTKCWTNSNPFHAFRTINDIKCWLDSTIRLDQLKIYKVELSEMLVAGDWGNNDDILTVTGRYCTLIEEVDLK